MSTSVAVIGGGALGLTASVELARRGAAVTLFEKDQLGSGATGNAAGICYDAYGAPRDAMIAARSLQRFRELGVLTDCPYVWFARDTDDVATAIESHVEQMHAAGRNVSLVSPASITDQFPAFLTDDITTMAVAHDGGYVDTMAYIDSLRATAAREAVDIVEDTPARVVDADGQRIDADGDHHEYDTVLVAAGAATEAVLSETPIELAVGYYRTQALVAEPTEPIPMFYDASAEWYGRPVDGGVLAGDGSAMYNGNPANYDRSADESFCEERLVALENRITAAAADQDSAVTDTLSIERSWAGLCTATPDRDPLLGECYPSIYVATGFCGHGFMRSPALGEAIAEQILGDDPTCEIDTFDPRRFDGSEPIDLPIGVTT